MEELDNVVFNFDNIDSKGKISLERAASGLCFVVEGGGQRYTGMIDLFYLGPANTKHRKKLSVLIDVPGTAPEMKDETLDMFYKVTMDKYGQFGVEMMKDSLDDSFDVYADDLALRGQ